MYEFSITGALAFTGAYLGALRKYDLRWLGLLVSISVLLTLGTAVTVLYVPSAPLVPALKSPWLVIHVSTAIISGGVFLLANVIAAAYLYLDNMETKGERTAWAKRLPSLEVLDQLSYRLVALYFHCGHFQLLLERSGLRVLGVATGVGIQKRPGHLLHGSHMPLTYMLV